MSDEQTNVDAGSETSGETDVTSTNETSATEQSDTNASSDTTTTDTAATDKAQADSDASADAGGAAGPANAGESRTEFVTGARAGDSCICPDGRKGTVHKFDEGLVCIPNHDQSE